MCHSSLELLTKKIEKCFRKKLNSLTQTFLFKNLSKTFF